MSFGYSNNPWGMQRPSFGQSLMSGGPIMPTLAGRGAPGAPGILQAPNPLFGGNGVTGWGDEGSVAAPQRKGFGALLAGAGQWLGKGDNLLGLGQLAASGYGAYKQGRAMDKQNEQEQEELEYRRAEREKERKRRGNADPLRLALIQRLMGGGQ